MRTIWKRIDDWLTVHALELGELLQPGAMDKEIHHAEAVMGVEFPEDIKASYCIHNGVHFSPLSSDFIAGRFALFSLKEIVEQWELWHRPVINITDYSEHLTCFGKEVCSIVRNISIFPNGCLK